jgi:hypothetical protein
MFIRPDGFIKFLSYADTDREEVMISVLRMASVELALYRNSV